PADALRVRPARPARGRTRRRLKEREGKIIMKQQIVTLEGALMALYFGLTHLTPATLRGLILTARCGAERAGLRRQSSRAPAAALALLCLLSPGRTLGQAPGAAKPGGAA